VKRSSAQDDSHFISLLFGFFRHSFQKQHFHSSLYVNKSVGRDSSVGIVTFYGRDGPGMEPPWRWNVPHPSRPALGPTQPPVKKELETLAPGIKWPGLESPHRSPPSGSFHLRIRQALHPYLVLPPCVYALFCFNVPHQFTTFPNLRPLIFGVTHFGCFIFVYWSFPSCGNTIFDWRLPYLRKLFQEHRQGVQQGLGVLPFLLHVHVSFLKHTKRKVTLNKSRYSLEVGTFRRTPLLESDSL
jgi:hypothetical protein